MLGPLADNGGPTQTLALLSGSPAVGAGQSGSSIQKRSAGILACR
ncbi:choice-of-anchor Q domain-containing protein [Vibrio metschnikovii]